MILASLFVPALLVFPGLAAQHSNNAHHHRGVARNLELQKKDVADDTHNLSKRAFNGRMTYYQTGTGACGAWNNPGDHIVALNSAQYGGGYPGPQCWKWITISYNGKTAQAQITDECPTCGWGELDLSQGLFEMFESTDKGIFNADWWFNDDNGGGGNQPTSTSQHEEPTTPPPPPPPETTSSTWSPPPETTTQQQETTSSTSTWVEPTTTSTSSSSSSTSSTTSESPTSTSSSTSTSASSTSESSTQGITPTGAVVDFNQLVFNVGGIAVAGATMSA